MSSTNRGAKRRPADYYPTPPWCVRALLRMLEQGHPDLLSKTPRIVDPFAGDGVILRSAREWFNGRGLYGAIEIRPEAAVDLQAPWLHCHIGDALKPGPRAALEPVLGEAAGEVMVLTNPAFSRTRPSVDEWAVKWPGPAAFLLPSSYYRGQGAASWWRHREPVRELKLPRRPAFVAVCKGISKTKTRKKVKGCGESYPIGTRGTCVCGGTIGDGTDSQDYIWGLWNVDPGPRPNRVIPLEWCE